MIDFGEHVGERKVLDLTPMLDVVFLLLVFFLLTSIFARPLLHLDLPEAASGLVAPEPEIAVTLHRDGTLALDDRAVGRDELQAALAALLEGRGAHRQVSLRADQTVSFGRVVEIMDVANRAGAEHLAVVTERGP